MDVIDSVHTGFHGHYHFVLREPNRISHVCASVGVDSIWAGPFNVVFAALVVVFERAVRPTWLCLDNLEVVNMAHCIQQDN